MENKISKFVLNRGLVHVKRYHNTPLHQQETVAEHSFFVALTASTICELVEENGEKINVQEVIEKALIHDIEESISGDIIQPFKHSNTQLNSLVNELNEKSVDIVFKDLPPKLAQKFKNFWTECGKHQKIEDKVVKIADNISLIAFCFEQIRLGNKYTVEILQKGLENLKKNEFTWLKPVISDIETEKRAFEKCLR